MCGIFGAVSMGGKINMTAIKGLAWANRQRGTDSIGFFDSEGRIIRKACDPAAALADKGMQTWLNGFNGWAVCGHTRFATQGSVCKRNAHPFRYGDITGSHNGMVDAPRNFIVDSEYLFDVIATKGYKALEDVDGYWGLSWFDASDNSFWLTMHDGQLAYTVCDDVVYYSSDYKHLASIVGGDIFTFVEGQVVKFSSDGTVEDSEQGDIEGLDVKYTFKPIMGYKACGVKAAPAASTVSADSSAKVLENAGFTDKDDYESWVARRESGGIAEDSDLNAAAVCTNVSERYEDDGSEDFRDAWSDYSEGADHEERELRNKGLHEMSEEEFKEFATGEVEYGGEG